MATVNILNTNDDAECKRWDDFIQAHPNSNWAMLTGFAKTLAETFGYKHFYFYLMNRSGDIRAVCPVFLVSHFFGQKQFISVPFYEYGGILAQRDISRDEINILLTSIESEAKKYQVCTVQFKANLGLPNGYADTLLKAKVYQQHAILQLSNSSDVWQQKLKKEVRKNIRKAKHLGVNVKQETNHLLIQDRFYPLYSSYMKQRHGAPPLPLHFFINLYQYLSSEMKMFWAYFKDHPIACLLGFDTGTRIHITNIVSDQHYWHLYPNDLLHWEFIQWACDNKFQYFDFGPARAGGQAQYKQKWGCDLYDYKIYTLPNYNFAGDRLTIDSIPFRFLSAMWRWTMPRVLANKLGPYIRKYMGK